jgi:hypothetical protein
MIHGSWSSVNTPERVFSRSVCRVSQKDSYAEHRCSCALPPVKLRDKKIRRKRSRDRGAKNGSYQGGQFEEHHMVDLSKEVFFQGVGKRLP